ITVTSNVIRRFSCSAGNVAQLGTPGDTLQLITLAGNTLAQSATTGTGGSCPTLALASAAQLAPANQVVVSGNHIGFAAAAPTIHAVTIGPTITAFSYVAVSNNTIDSVSLAAAFEIGGGNSVPPLVIVSNNLSRGATTGVQVDLMQSPYIPMIANNRFDGAATAIALSTSNPAVEIRSNNAGPSHFFGAGSPAAPIP